MSMIEQATFRFVAQHLNHCATAIPPYNPVLFPIIIIIIVVVVVVVVIIIFLFSFSGWQHPNHCSSDDNKKTSNRDELLCDVIGCC